jgi:hypothetical protein
MFNASRFPISRSDFWLGLDYSGIGGSGTGTLDVIDGGTVTDGGTVVGKTQAPQEQWMSLGRDLL